MSDEVRNRPATTDATAQNAAEPAEAFTPGASARERKMRRRARRRAANMARVLAPINPETGENLPVPSQEGEAEPPRPQIESPEEREARIAEIQRGLIRRRRRRGLLLLLRLIFFVVLPTAVAGHYYFLTATPMYETKSEFVIQKAEAATPGGSGLGGILSSFGLADAKDSIAVQGYLTSLQAMNRLDAEQGFIRRFQDPAIDVIQRLPPDASHSEAYELYRRHVIVGFDRTEGIIRMRVIAPDRATSESYSRALISYAEEMVDNLSARAREENMRGAEQSFAQRQADVRAAAKRVLELQQQYDTFSAEGELQIDLSVIQAQELELERLKRKLDELMANPRPNAAQKEVLERQIAFTEKAIASRRAALTASGRNGISLAAINSQLQMAQSDLAAKEQMRVIALNALEQARSEAARQVRYLSVNVPPIAPDEPTYPRRLENTAVAFFVFLGIYIMVSLTASILREQVSV
ncbi:MAG: capsule biosynthesis protein [Alphaproteobacteria bacterium]|nr:MAG: capsule biosynthesis protein [Alphaproteobacteria bacterium]